MSIKYENISDQYRASYYSGDKLDFSATALSYIEFFLTVALPAYVKQDLPQAARKFYASLSREQAITGLTLLVMVGIAVTNKLLGL